VALLNLFVALESVHFLFFNGGILAALSIHRLKELLLRMEFLVVFVSPDM
jgi:hypothetical protein